MIIIVKKKQKKLFHVRKPRVHRKSSFRDSPRKREVLMRNDFQKSSPRSKFVPLSPTSNEALLVTFPRYGSALSEGKRDYLNVSSLVGLPVFPLASQMKAVCLGRGLETEGAVRRGAAVPAASHSAARRHTRRMLLKPLSTA